MACARDVAQSSVRGMVSGLVNMGVLVGAAIAQPVFGYILDLGWEGEMLEGTCLYTLEIFQQGLWVRCIFAALGFLGALLIKEIRYREIYGVPADKAD